MGVRIGVSFSFALPFPLDEIALALDVARDRDGVGSVALTLDPSVLTTSSLPGVRAPRPGVGLFKGAFESGVRVLDCTEGLAGVKVGRLGEETGDLYSVRVLARDLLVGGDGWRGRSATISSGVDRYAASSVRRIGSGDSAGILRRIVTMVD